MSSQSREFSWPIRVYYEDTDSGGVVYYANYLRYMERARTELLRSIGFEQDQLIEEQGVLFAVRNASIEYRKPARFNDELNVITSISALGKASISFRQSVYRQLPQAEVIGDSPAADLLSEAEIKIACLNAKKFTPQSIPAQIITRINQEFHCGS